MLSLTEEDRVQAALDIAEAVFYLHNLSTPAVHQYIAARYRYSVPECTPIEKPTLKKNSEPMLSN